MDISTNIRGNYLLVRLKGDFDMHTAPDFKEKVISKMEENDLKQLVLNLNQVNFIDSTGLGAILGRYRNLTDKGGKLILVGLNSQVKRILKLSGVLELMPVYESEKEVFKKLKGGQNIV